MSRFISFFCCLIYILNCSSQSPGDVSTNLKLWLKADAGVTGGSPVTAWADQSGNGNNAGDVDGPDLTTNAINFNPACTFDGNSENMTISGGVLGTDTYTDVNIYYISKADAVKNGYILNEQNNIWRISITSPWGNGFLYWDAGGVSGNHRLGTLWGGTTGEFNLWSLNYSTASTQSGNKQDIFRNGTSIANDVTASSFTGTGNNMYIGSNHNGTGAFFDGDIAEVIMYTGAISSTEQNQIQTYLAIKYGITLANNGVLLGGYAASDGGIIWNASDNSSYYNDIAGIGRDDNSGLDQRVSKSINADAKMIVSIENDFTSTNAARTIGWTANDSWLIWGNDNGNEDFTSAYNGGSRFTRVWKQQNTGTVPSVYVQFTDDNITDGNSYDLAGSNDLINWNELTTSDASGTTVRFGAADLTAYSYFTITTGGAALPVSLLNWNVQRVNKDALVKWTVAEEINNSYYTIEHSLDGESFEKLDTISGAGNSNSILKYEWKHENIALGKNYYRLSQTDFDGKTRYYDTKVVEYSILNDLKAYPNPVKENFKVSFKAAFAMEMELLLVDNLGRQVEKRNLKVSKGKNVIDINANNISSGLYYCRLINTDLKLIENIMVSRGE